MPQEYKTLPFTNPYTQEELELEYPSGWTHEQRQKAIEKLLLEEVDKRRRRTEYEKHEEMLSKMSPKERTFFEATKVLGGAAGPVGRTVEGMLSPESLLLNLLGPLGQAVQTARGSAGMFDKALESSRQSKPSPGRLAIDELPALGYTIAGLLPGIGPAAAGVGESFTSGGPGQETPEVSKGLGGAASLLLPFLFKGLSGRGSQGGGGPQAQGPVNPNLGFSASTTGLIPSPSKAPPPSPGEYAFDPGRMEWGATQVAFGGPFAKLAGLRNLYKSVNKTKAKHDVDHGVPLVEKPVSRQTEGPNTGITGRRLKQLIEAAARKTDPKPTAKPPRLQGSSLERIPEAPKAPEPPKVKKIPPPRVVFPKMQEAPTSKSVKPPAIQWPQKPPAPPKPPPVKWSPKGPPPDDIASYLTAPGWGRLGRDERGRFTRMDDA